MPSEELTRWHAYATVYGLPLDRLEWLIANAGAAVVGSNGGKIKPNDLIPKIEQAITDPEVIKALFQSLGT